VSLFRLTPPLRGQSSNKKERDKNKKEKIGKKKKKCETKNA
jgi:hypothetical protein